MTAYRLWTKYPYAGEKNPPANPVNPYAGSWPMYFFTKDRGLRFKTRNNKSFSLAIRHPRLIDWNKELKIVQKVLKSITPSQISIAKYWGTGVATKQMTPIIDRLIDTYGSTPPEAARILASVQAGIHDAFVITWFLKYLWNAARPNQYDPKMSTIICTPRFPTYPSGHSVMAGCAQNILTYFFPPEAPRLKQLAGQVALSRVYGGIHFPVDIREGLRLGRQLGRLIVEKLQEERDQRNRPIDVPVLKNRHAKLPPPPYRQAIPFNFNKSCQSKVKK